LGTYSPVWSPDSTTLAFIDDRLSAEGEIYLETATLTANYKRLKAGVTSAASWQRMPMR
jgi:hypothetical protein